MLGKPWSDPTHPAHVPTRGYSRAPFTVGHTKSLKHGAESPRTVEPLAAQFIEMLEDSAPYLADPAYRPALERWAVAEARALLYERWLDKHEHLDDPGFDPDGTAWCRSELHRWQRRASDEADRLGLSPLSRAKLGRDVAAGQLDIAQLWARMADQEGDGDGT